LESVRALLEPIDVVDGVYGPACDAEGRLLALKAELNVEPPATSLLRRRGRRCFRGSPSTYA
jgi:hypothetical protein